MERLHASKRQDGMRTQRVRLLLTGDYIGMSLFPLLDNVCIVCGQTLKIDGISNHHCNPTTENRIEGSRQGSGNRDHNIEMSVGQRIAYGFEILNENEGE